MNALSPTSIVSGFLPPGNTYASVGIGRLFERVLVGNLVVFIPLILAIKFNQFLFYHYDTSPAVILIPTGIALAAVYLGGYSMAFSVAAAWLVGTLTNPVGLPLLISVVAAAAYTLQAVVGRYLLITLRFSGTLRRTRDALVILGVALILAMVAPSITTLFQVFTNTLTTASPWVSWSRSWAGGVLNIIIFTPLITSWLTRYAVSATTEWLESAGALACLTFITYLTFWTSLPRYNTFVVLYLLFAVLFWIGLRLHPRFVTAAIALIAVFGMAGSILANQGLIPLNQQLLADELFVILIAPIFFILAALVEQGRVSSQQAAMRAHELEAANKKLSLEDQAKNEFLATLAHELRNPLAPVVSSLELLKIELKELNRPDLLELVQIADAHNLTLTHLLDDLLDVSRISRKKFKLHKVSTSVETMVIQARRTIDALYKQKGHTLHVVMAEENLWINADPLRLEQILVNLLNNAGKYTEPGGDITLTLKREKENLRIEVADTGIGIEEHMLSRIFEPFVQSDGHSAGLGIGLSLTKRLVELHGGKTWAESKGKGKGSVFTVILPGVENVQLPLRVPAHRSRNEVGGIKTNGSKATFSILVVDDNEAAAKGLCKLLTHGGHTVRSAYSGAEALILMRESESDIVLLDIGMPDMDGYAVARTLREEYGKTPLVLVALTGYGQEEDKQKAEAAGFNYHLTKPVSVQDVESVLSSIHFNRVRV